MKPPKSRRAHERKMWGFWFNGVSLCMIELRQLRYLLAAAEAGSFNRAARSMNIKQSTLSRQVHLVEKRLGMILFDRKSHGARLTACGETYLRVAQRIVSEFEELNEWVRSTRDGKTGSLAIGFYTSLSAGNLRATLVEFHERHPDIVLRSFERDRDMLLGGIESGLLDIVIMIGEAAYPAFASRPVWSERILVALPEGHQLAERDRIYWPDLAGERFLLTQRDPGPETRNVLIGKLGAPGMPVSIEINDITRDSLLSTIALGRYASIVAESALGVQFPGVVFREIHENCGHMRIGFSAYWRAENANPVLRRFLDFVSTRYSLPEGAG